MPANLSSYGSSYIAGMFFGAQNAIPANLYLGLLTVAPDPTNTGSQVFEPIGNGYARVTVANTATNWNVPQGGVVTNKTTIQFPAATGDWGSVTHYAIFTAATAGEFYLYASFDLPRRIVSGNQPSFGPGQLFIAVTGTPQTIVAG